MRLPEAGTAIPASACPHAIVGRANTAMGKKGVGLIQRTELPWRAGKREGEPSRPVVPNGIALPKADDPDSIVPRSLSRRMEMENLKRANVSTRSSSAKRERCLNAAARERSERRSVRPHGRWMAAPSSPRKPSYPIIGASDAKTSANGLENVLL